MAPPAAELSCPSSPHSDSQTGQSRLSCSRGSGRGDNGLLVAVEKHHCLCHWAGLWHSSLGWVQMGRVVLALPLWKGVRKSQRFVLISNIKWGFLFATRSTVMGTTCGSVTATAGQGFTAAALLYSCPFLAVLSTHLDEVPKWHVSWERAQNLPRAKVLHPDSAATFACSLRI